MYPSIQEACEKVKSFRQNFPTEWKNSGKISLTFPLFLWYTKTSEIFVKRP